MLPNTVERVPLNTSEEINQRIARETNRRVNFYAANPIGIEQRLRELDEKWDIERVLEANAASAAFAGMVFAATVHKRWLMLSVLVSGFLFQHAVQGWCPPVPILRRLGYRTSREIETERIALKELRGDFGKIGPANGERDNQCGKTP